MFDLIKQSVSLLDVLEKDLGVTFKQSGEKNWIIDGDKDIESCPFCGHHGCFKVHFSLDSKESSFYKCFSCGETGDVVTWVAKRKGLSMGDALKDLAKEHQIELPTRATNPIQSIFTSAAGYYHSCLMESCDSPQPFLSGLTPKQYQLEVRKHKEESLSKFKVGYSDGGLAEFLLSVGYDPEVLLSSGLVKAGKTEGSFRDFLPAKCFIYPHYVKGMVSHFTFKDPTKRLDYQLPKKYSLNGYLFYGQETFDATRSLVLVEGENDRISVMESGKATSVLATIGQISGEQLEWLRNKCRDRLVITLFDPDDAGDLYRIKVEMSKSHFGQLIQVRPPEEKDIDELLRDGGDLLEIIRNNRVEVKIPDKMIRNPSISLDDILKKPEKPSEAVEEAKIISSIEGLEQPLEAPTSEVDATVPPAAEKPSEGPSAPFETSSTKEVASQVVGPKHEPSGYEPPAALSSITSEDRPSEVAEIDENPTDYDSVAVYASKGCYWRRSFNKDGEAIDTRISDFNLILKNIYVYEKGDRKREVLLRRYDGKTSDPFMIDSETKVSVKLFKTLVAKMADCEWMGRDQDLDAMWRHVYSSVPDAIIKIPQQVGKQSDGSGWLFRDLFISTSGAVFQADENGVFWLQGKSMGIKPPGINSEEPDTSMVPEIEYTLNREEADQLLKEAIEHLGRNLNSLGKALLAIGWIYSNVYSDLIFKTNKGMSILLLWSLHGAGKSTIISWLRYFIGMNDHVGRSSINQLRSAIGFLRQGAYYSSLPMFLDELRNDELSNNYMGMIRSWYDREGRVIAAQGATDVRTQRIRSNLVIAGEDLPEDPATRERMVTIRIPKNDEGREVEQSYKWFQQKGISLSNITYYWIKDACYEPDSTFIEGMAGIDRQLKAAGCSSRISKNWSAAGYLGERLRQKFFPEYDFINYLVKESQDQQTQQVEDSTLNGFYEYIDVLMSLDNAKISKEHIRSDDEYLYIWMNAVHSIVKESIRKDKSNWSRNALLRAIREEPYYVSEREKKAMGMAGTRRAVLKLRLSNAPDVLKDIASRVKD